MPVFKKSKSDMQIVSPGVGRRLANLVNLMVVVMDFSNGPMEIPEKPHSHPHEQITYVEEGELFFFLGEEKHHLTKGDIVTIPSGKMHCVQTITGFVRLVDSFSPVRKDFIVSNK